MSIARRVKPKPPVYASFFSVETEAGDSTIWFGFTEMNGVILDFWVCQGEYQAMNKREDLILREKYGAKTLACIQWYIDNNIYPNPERGL